MIHTPCHRWARSLGTGAPASTEVEPRARARTAHGNATFIVPSTLSDVPEETSSRRPLGWKRLGGRAVCSRSGRAFCKGVSRYTDERRARASPRLISGVSPIEGDGTRGSAMPRKVGSTCSGKRSRFSVGSVRLRESRRHPDRRLERPLWRGHLRGEPGREERVVQKVKPEVLASLEVPENERWRRWIESTPLGRSGAPAHPGVPLPHWPLWVSNV